MSNEKLKQIRQEKELEYGSFDANMNYIGKAWSALLGLETDIPGHMVANMYVAAKLIRTNQKFKQDTYDDAANYLYQAELMQKVDQARDDYYAEKILEEQMTPKPDVLTPEQLGAENAAAVGNANHKINYPKDEPDEQ